MESGHIHKPTHSPWEGGYARERPKPPKTDDGQALDEKTDHAEKAISTEARPMLKELLAGRIEAEFEDLVGCGRYKRSEERQDHRNGFWTRGPAPPISARAVCPG
jgi:hypothetical protein